MKRWVVTVVGLLVLSAVTSGSVSAKGGPALKCSLVPRSVIASTLGLNLLSGRGTRTYPWTRSCAYFGKNKDSPLVVVTYQPRFLSTRFIRQFGSEPGDHQITGGIGNLIHAFYSEGPSPGQTSVSVLGVRNVFQIQASSDLARIKALARKIAPFA